MTLIVLMFLVYHCAGRCAFSVLYPCMYGMHVVDETLLQTVKEKK